MRYFAEEKHNIHKNNCAPALAIYVYLKLHNMKRATALALIFAPPHATESKHE